MDLKHRKGIPAGVAKLAELRSQRAELDRQIQQLEQEERGSIVDTARSLIKEYGLTAADFAPSKKRVSGPRKPGTPKGSKVAPKFRNPSTGDTWSRPRIAAAMAQSSFDGWPQAFRIHGLRPLTFQRETALALRNKLDRFYVMADCLERVQKPLREA